VSARWLRLPDGYDVVYASAQFIFEVYPSLVIARRKRARLAVKIHHMLSAQPERKGFFDQLYLWVERISTRLINRHANTIVCSPQLVAQDYRRLETSLGLKPRQTHQIAYGLDMQIIKPRWDQPKVYDAVFLGRMHEHKGIFELPEVWAEVVRHVPKARLLVIGEGPHRQRTSELFAQRGLAHAVQFTGGVSEAQKNQFLTQARIGISLSYEEGWGLSITEYLAAGLPVIAYELPVYSLAFPGHLDLVPPKSPLPMARKIIDLLNAPEDQLKRGREGRLFVERYDYRKIAAAELEAIRGDSTPAV
jgi:glycosyltransferase involved in cell wall biosynthesis